MDGTHPQTLFSAPPSQTQPSYAAFGGLQKAAFGNGLAVSRTYDLNRMWVTSETDTGSIVVNPTPGSATVTITGTEQSK